MEKIILESIGEHVQAATALRDGFSGLIAQLAEVMIKSLEAGGKVLWCGNGGSAGDAQHLAAELLGRFKRERAALPSIALTTDTSVLTAIGNDYGYEHVFSRQVEGLLRPGDVLVGISTSGNSENVIRAIRKARSGGGRTIGLLGREGGKLKSECDFSLVVPSSDTARIQEMHILVGHILCDLIERKYSV